MCPVFLAGERREIFAAWGWQQRGFLPHAGGWADQDARTVEQLDIVESAIARARAEQAEQERVQRALDG